MDKALDDLLVKLDRIRTLAERAGTVHEAEAASAKMQQLLYQYNVSLEQVELFAEQSGRTVKMEEYDTDSAVWKKSLMAVVAEAHMCRAVSRHKRNSEEESRWMEVFGHTHNLIVVRDVYSWLLGHIEHLTGDYHDQAVRAGDEDAIYSVRTWKSSFRTGVVIGIKAAYDEQRHLAEDAAGDAWAIVPVLEAEVMAERDKRFPKLKKGQAMQYRNPGATMMGIAVGGRLSLNRQVKDGTV